MTPGSLNGNAVDVFQEGLRLNYLKVTRSGESEVLRLIFDNVRATREAVSDFHSVLGICRVAERRLRDVSAKYGLDVVKAATDAILDASEQRHAAAIAVAAVGDVFASRLISTAMPRRRIRCTCSWHSPSTADSIHADFTGIVAQVRLR